MLAKMTATPDNRRRSKGLLSIVTAFVVIGVVFSQRQPIYDWWMLRDYQAPANVVALADVTTMTPQSRHDFYVNHPSVEDKTAFNQHCPGNGGEQTIVLGCYIPPQRGIYVYNVSDPQLRGVQEVTAAHEMLHSAYDRLSSKDRAYVNGLLQDYYRHDLHDQRLIDTLNSYKKTEPNDLVNEMHSIFGTEVVNLPPALEDYYKQYFTNRQAVTAFATQYQSAFTSRQNEITNYDNQLKELKNQIDANEASLSSRSASLSAQRQQLNQLLASDNTAAYNAQVDSFNSNVNAYNALIASTKAKINLYNDIVKKRNAVAVETQNLSQELNSHLQTQTSQ
jgi:hypothetical protein